MFAQTDVNEIENETALIDSTVEALLSIHRQSRQTPSQDEESLAHAKLNGNGWSYCISKLSVVLGNKFYHLLQQPQGGSQDAGEVDVHLGDGSDLMHKFARIEFNFISRLWEIIPIDGQNLMVNRIMVLPNTSCSLNSGDKLYAGQKLLCSFTLPDDGYENPNNCEESSASNDLSVCDENLRQDDVDHRRKRTSRQRIKNTPESAAAILQNEKSLNRKRARMIFVPNHEDGVDWKTDKADPKKKPPYSYASLIAEAIMSDSSRKMTLSKIYSFIQENYSYYRNANNGWQNSVRHNLSLNEAFVKVARDKTDYGKGMYWTIDLKFVLNPEMNDKHDENEAVQTQNQIQQYQQQFQQMQLQQQKQQIQQLQLQLVNTNNQQQQMRVPALKPTYITQAPIQVQQLSRPQQLHINPMYQQQAMRPVKILPVPSFLPSLSNHHTQQFTALHYHVAPRQRSDSICDH